MRKSLRGTKTRKRRKEESPEIQVRFSSDHDKLDFYRADYLKSGLIHRIPLYPFCLEEAVRTRKTFFHASRSDFLQMILLLEGRVQYTVRKRNFSLAPGQLMMIPLDAEYGFETTGRVHKLVLELKGASLATMAEILGLNRPVLLTLDEPERWIGRFREIRDRMLRQEEGEAEELPALLGETYALLSRLAFSQTERGSPNLLLAALLENLDHTSERRESVGMIAKRLNVSVSTLNRLCREGIRCSPSRHRMIRRLEQAKELLADTSLSMKEIAQMTGYCNQYYFSSEFKRHFGTSPSQWREGVRQTRGFPENPSIPSS